MSNKHSKFTCLSKIGFANHNCQQKLTISHELSYRSHHFRVEDFVRLRLRRPRLERRRSSSWPCFKAGGQVVKKGGRSKHIMSGCCYPRFWDHNKYPWTSMDNQEFPLFMHFWCLEMLGKHWMQISDTPGNFLAAPLLLQLSVSKIMKPHSLCFFLTDALMGCIIK